MTKDLKQVEAIITLELQLTSLTQTDPRVPDRGSRSGPDGSYDMGRVCDLSRT